MISGRELFAQIWCLELTERFVGVTMDMVRLLFMCWLAELTQQTGTQTHLCNIALSFYHFYFCLAITLLSSFIGFPFTLYSFYFPIYFNTFVPSVVLASYFSLAGTDTIVFFCTCNPSNSGFCVMCI